MRTKKQISDDFENKPAILNKYFLEVLIDIRDELKIMNERKL